MNYLILVFIAVAGIIVGGLLGVRKRQVLIAEQSKKKQENKDKVLEFLLGLSTSPRQVTNDNVEELCGVSNATAERYLNELEKEGKIQQHGQTGTNVFYTLK